MKLRIRGSSIRLRLLRSEVQALSDTGRVVETVEFGPGNCLRYSLESRDNQETISAHFHEGKIQVIVPATMARQWASTEQVGLTAEQATGGESPLRVLIEKDFQCLKPRTSGQWEDESDAFPNPNPTCGHST